MTEESVSARVERIQARQEALGLTVNRLADLAGVDRGQLARILRGEVARPRGSTLGTVEAALARFEEEVSGPYDEKADAGEERLVTFRVSGNFGVDVVVQGPVGDLDELEAAVERLIRKMRSTD